MRLHSFQDSPSRLLAGLLMLAASCLAGNATASVIEYKLTIAASPDENEPTLTLENLSDPGFDIIGFNLTIGDPVRNFDAAGFENDFGNGITFIRNSPDGNIAGGVRSDNVDYDFIGFNPSESGSIQLDIDAFGDTFQDFRTVFFNNGAADNSIVTVEFSGGHSLVMSLPDGPLDDAVYMFQDRGVLAMSEPAVSGLLAVGLLGLVARRRRAAHAAVVVRA